MSNSAAAQFILYQTDGGGAGIADVLNRVQRASGVKLLRQGGEGLLVSGEPAAVQSLADAIPGWQSEPNQAVRGGV